MRDDYTLPADVDMLGLFPHAHYLARTMRSWARLPDGTEKALLAIDDWDFNWQDTYTYATPITLPAGTVILMEFVYDNSADNVRNPRSSEARHDGRVVSRRDWEHHVPGSPARRARPGAAARGELRASAAARR